MVCLSVAELAELAESAAERGAERALRAVGELVREDGGASGAIPGERASAPGLVSAEALARELGMSRAHVYEHAQELGVIRLGDGPRARLRFDPEAARAALARYGSEQSQPRTANAGGDTAAPAPRRRRSLASHRPKPGGILPSRPRNSA